MERVQRGLAASGFIQQLVDVGSAFGRQIAGMLTTRVGDYLASLIPDEVPAGTANPHLHVLATAMERYLTERGEHSVDEVCDALLRVPVIQQADHSALLLDEETFLNNYLFHMAAGNARLRIAISSQCSTVSCFSRRVPPRGPVFLHTRGALYGVFPFSKRMLKNSTFCTLPGPLTMTFDVLAGAASPALDDDPVLSRFVGRTHPDAPSAYRKCNEEIWGLLDVDHSIRRVAVDEAMASEAVALHLEDESSPIHQLIFRPSVRDTFLRTKRRLVASAANVVVNRSTPDFFWLRIGSRLRGVVVAGGGDDARLTLEADGSEVPIPYRPSSIGAALRNGALHLNKILAYTVRCLLPGVVAVGGTAQQDYVDLYRRMLLDTHREVPFLEADDVSRITRTDLSRLGGMPLLELDAPSKAILARLGPSTDLAEFERSFRDKTLGETVGRLECASFYHDRFRILEQHQA